MPIFEDLEVSLIEGYKSLVKMNKGKEANTSTINEDVKKFNTF